MTTEKKTDEIRFQVSEAYRDALRRSQAGKSGCCSSKVAIPAQTASSCAGYGAEKEAHAEASQSSFGCGNPLAFAEVQPGETVLDLGSGAGFDLLIAADKVGPAGRVIGVDMTDDMIEAARANAKRAGYDTIEVRRGVIEELPVEDGSVDWVISNCVVNLSPEKERVFAEIARVLKPGGRFSISDIVAEDLPRAMRDAATVYAACIGGAISEKEYVAGLEAVGLTEVVVSQRLLYDADQIRGLVGSEADWGGESLAAVVDDLPHLVGKVATVRLGGRKP